MNRATRNAIATAINPYTGFGKTRDDYFEIIKIVRTFGFIVADKVADEYTPDMSSKHNAYALEDMRTEQEIDHLLIIDEYFGRPQEETTWRIGKGYVTTYRESSTHEINAYIS